MTDNFTLEHITDRVLTPARAEVEIAVSGPAGEVRGRLMGPTCQFSATVEVAYPMRPVGPQPTSTLQIIIPEPCLWEPQSPFLYHGPVEWWEEGKMCGRIQVSHGLRSLALGPRGLRINGKPIFLRGVSRDRISEAELLALRAAGCNAIVAPAESGLWDAADRLGFLMIGRPSPEMDRVARQRHAATLGWLLPADHAGRMPSPELGYLGVELDERRDELPSWASFVAGPGELALSTELPALVLSDSEITSEARLLGWVRL